MLETLQARQAKEAHVLSERLVRCEAAHQLCQNAISSFRRADLLKLMLTLQDDMADVRDDTLTEVVTKLVTGNIELFLTKDLLTPDDQSLATLQSLVASLCLWHGSDDIPEFSGEMPSLRPVLTRLLNKDRRGGDKDFDDLMEMEENTGSADNKGAATATSTAEAIKLPTVDELWED